MSCDSSCYKGKTMSTKGLFGAMIEYESSVIGLRVISDEDISIDDISREGFSLSWRAHRQTAPEVILRITDNKAATNVVSPVSLAWLRHCHNIHPSSIIDLHSSSLNSTSALDCISLKSTRPVVHCLTRQSGLISSLLRSAPVFRDALRRSSTTGGISRSLCRLDSAGSDSVRHSVGRNQ